MCTNPETKMFKFVLHGDSGAHVTPQLSCRPDWWYLNYYVSVWCSQSWPLKVSICRKEQMPVDFTFVAGKDGEGEEKEKKREKGQGGNCGNRLHRKLKGRVRANGSLHGRVLWKHTDTAGLSKCTAALYAYLRVLVGGFERMLPVAPLEHPHWTLFSWVLCHRDTLQPCPQEESLTVL